jgi:pSer/pThr/pTyr-binding forkhead associated (FHA) protein
LVFYINFHFQQEGKVNMDGTIANPTAPDNPKVVEQSVFLIINRQIIPLEKGQIRLGRQFENDIVFHEEHISRFHAEIHFEDGKYVIYDLRSTSGTYVNNRRVDRCALNSGDLISLANLHIMFVNNNSRITDKSTINTKSLGKDFGDFQERKYE